MLEKATIVESFGRQYIIETSDKQLYQATTRGKKVDYAVGDIVQIKRSNAEQAVIEKTEERSSLIYRSDAFKSKLIAANVTQLMLIIASEPYPNWNLLQRGLIAASAADVSVKIVLNKMDLPNEALREQLKYFKNLGYPLIEVCAITPSLGLNPHLKDQDTVLVGQSGVGKSTIINHVLGKAIAKTGALSQIASGTHTTTHAKRYTLPEGGNVIDVPGLAEFGLHHIPAQTLQHHMPDFQPFLNQCRFANCLHLAEPNCRIKTAVENGEILQDRYLFYTKEMGILLR